MKALSLLPEWAQMVYFAEKFVECRTWKTDYRGDLLICASSKKLTGTIDSHAVCVVTLEDVVPFTEEHLDQACMDEMPDKESYAWIFSNVWLIEPFPVKGKLHLFDVPDEQIVFPEEDYKDVFRKYYLPKVYFARNDDEWPQIWDDIISGKQPLNWSETE